MGETERAFLLAAQAREQEEQQRERRRTQRLRRLVVALAALLAVALASTVTAVHSSREAAAGERTARLNEKLALLGVPSVAGNSQSALLLAASAWAGERTDASASALLSTQAHPYAGALKGHTGSVRAVAWTGDNRHLVSGGGDGTVRVWDVRSRRQVREFSDGAAVRAVCEAAGIHNILTKSFGSNNPLSLVKATIHALTQLRPKQEIERLRGVSLHES